MVNTVSKLIPFHASLIQMSENYDGRLGPNFNNHSIAPSLHRTIVLL